MQSWNDMSGRQKLAIGATTVAVLAIGGAVATDRFRSDEPVEPEPTRAQVKPTEDPRPVGKRLELGAVAKISDNYSVAVTELALYEGEDAQFLASTIKAEYIGADEGEPWADLSVEFAGADGRTAGESTCSIDVGNEPEESDQAPLTDGDVRTYVVCIGVPSRDIEGGRIFVEEALADGPRRSWSTDEVVAKEIPRAVPGAPGGRPATEFRPPSGGDGSGNDDVCEKYEDDVEEYRDGIDELNELAERYKDHDEYEDEIDEFEEWKDTMDANVERYEQVC